MNVATLDIAIVVVSLLTVVSFGVYTSSRKGRRGSDGDAYFLAGRCMPFYVVGASLFAANFGSEQFIGMAGTAAKSGLAVASYELSAPFLLILLGWVFAPLYKHCNVRTTPEYMELRFNKYCRLVFVCVLIATHILATIASTLYAGSVVLEVVTGLTIWQSAPIIVLSTALYTITGGLKAVMLTDTLQCCILLTGGIVGSVTALNLVGGISGLFEKLEAVKLDEFPHLMRPLNDRDFPWLGTWIALMIGGLRCWCLDQEMAQRVLSAKNLHHARLGTAGAGLLKLFPLFIMTLPGMTARLLFELCQGDNSGETFPEWCDTALSGSHGANRAYPLLVLHEFPSGVKGLMLASFLAAMMSSLASLFNSVSAMFTYDIYIRFLSRTGRNHPHDSPRLILGTEALGPREITRVGRLAIVGLVVLTFLWIPVIDASDRSLFMVASEIISHLGPAITAVFLCGILFKRVNEQGALAGLLVGSLLGASRLALFLIFQQTCDSHVHDNRQTLTAANWIFCLNFHYFSPILFALTILLVLVVSSLYPLPSAEQITGRVITYQLLNTSDTPSAFSYQDLPTDSREEEKQSDDGSTAEGMYSMSVFELASAIVLPFIVLGATLGVIVYFR